MKRPSEVPRFRMISWLPLLSLAFPLVLGCEDEDVFRVVEVRWEEGMEEDEEWGTLNLFGVDYIPQDEGASSFLPLVMGDRVLVEVTSNGVYVPIFPSDGNLLTFGVLETMVTLGGAPVALALTDDEGWDWLGQATAEDQASLRVISIEDPVSPEHFPLLEDLALLNPEVDLATDQREDLPRLLELFDPRALTLADAPSFTEQTAMIAQEPGLRELMIQGDDFENLSFLKQIPNLEKLIIGGLNPSETGPLPDSLPKLRSIMLHGLEVQGLEALGHQPELEEFNLLWYFGDEESGPLNIQALARHSELELVSFRNCDVGDYTPLEGLDELSWLTLPSSTTQGQLEAVALSHPDLTFLEFIEAEEITDLTPLTDLRKLKGLIVGSAAPPDPLFTMTQLEYLAVVVEDDDSTAFTPEVFTRLKTVLPETVVTQVEVTQFCLGSGFILLLFPMVGCGAWILGRRRRRRRAATQNG